LVNAVYGQNKKQIYKKKKYIQIKNLSVSRDKWKVTEIWQVSSIQLVDDVKYLVLQLPPVSPTTVPYPHTHPSLSSHLRESGISSGW